MADWIQKIKKEVAMAEEDAIRLPKGTREDTDAVIRTLSARLRDAYNMACSYLMEAEEEKIGTEVMMKGRTLCIKVDKALPIRLYRVKVPKYLTSYYEAVSDALVRAKELMTENGIIYEDNILIGYTVHTASVDFDNYDTKYITDRIVEKLFSFDENKKCDSPERVSMLFRCVNDGKNLVEIFITDSI